MNAEIADKHRFKLLSPEEIMLLPDPTWIIDKVLPQKVVTQLYGESGCYKSFAALDMALSICSGIPWMGKYKTTQSKVIYVGAEGGPGYKKRIISWLADNNLKISAIEDNFRFLPESLPLDSSLDCEVFLHKVVDFVGKDAVDLIILDTQARCTEGVDENSSTEMGLIVKQIDRFKKLLHTTVLLVHHTGYTEGRARGSSAVKAALDTQFSMRKTKNKMVVRFKCEKQKDWEDGWHEDLLLMPVGTSLVIGKGDKVSLDTIDMAWLSLSPKRRSLLKTLQAEYFNGSANGLSYSEWLEKTSDVMSKPGFVKAIKTFKDQQLVDLVDEKYIPVPGLPV